MSETATIKCTGCDKTQTVRPQKVERCDGSSFGACSLRAPNSPDGSVVYLISNVVGGFRSHWIQAADFETHTVLQRVRVLYDAGLK